MQWDQNPGLRALALNPERAAPQLAQAGPPPGQDAVLAWKLPLAGVWGFHTGPLGLPPHRPSQRPLGP